MALFDVPKRPGKTADLKAAKKSKAASKSAGAIKSGNSVLAKISNIKAIVEKQLGHLRDKYIVIDSSPKLQEYLGNCIRNGIISIDTETTGLDPLVDKIVGLCLYTPNQPAAYVPINHVSYVTGVRVEGQLTENQVSVAGRRAGRLHKGDCNGRCRQECRWVEDGAPGQHRGG